MTTEQAKAIDQAKDVGIEMALSAAEVVLRRYYGLKDTDIEFIRDRVMRRLS